MEVLAQAPDFKEVAGWVGAAGSSGILAWFLWYTVSRWMPAREQKHDDTLSGVVTKHDATVNRLVDKHDATVAKLVQDFRDERTAAQANFRASLQTVVDHCAEENNRFIAALERSHPSQSANDAKRGGHA